MTLHSFKISVEQVCWCVTCVVSCEQLLIVDGVQLRSSPAQVMDGIQKFLGVTPYYNYTQALMYELALLLLSHTQIPRALTTTRCATQLIVSVLESIWSHKSLKCNVALIKAFNWIRYKIFRFFTKSYFGDVTSSCSLFKGLTRVKVSGVRNWRQDVLAVWERAKEGSIQKWTWR